MDHRLSTSTIVQEKSHLGMAVPMIDDELYDRGPYGVLWKRALSGLLRFCFLRFTLVCVRR